MPRILKRAVVMTLDVTLGILALWVSVVLISGSWRPIFGVPTLQLVVSVLLTVPTFFFMGIYSAVFRFYQGRSLLSVFKAISIYGLLFFLTLEVGDLHFGTRFIGVIQPILLFLFVALSRLLIGLGLGSLPASDSSPTPRRRVVIYGAGESGRRLAESLKNSAVWKFVGFMDDDPELWGSTINGWTVFAPERSIWLLNAYNVQEVWLAIPTASSTNRKKIIDLIRSAQVHVRTLPSFQYVLQKKIHASDLKELSADELLGRSSVQPNFELLRRTVYGKTVLVTGAGGSIGSEICRQIIHMQPTRLILVEQSEYALYSIHKELLEIYRVITNESSGDQENNSPLGKLTSNIIPIMGSVTDESFIGDLFDKWRPDSIYHAAAYKHVPMAEMNVCSTVFNNVWGTFVCVDKAVSASVSWFVLISTDKAVRPTNVMGASKRLAEMIVQAYATASVDRGPIFSAVRFGNVLDSSGSVVPLFREQISNGGPITLTHPDVTRYFMTIPEAAQLVLQAAGMSSGGEMFVLDMGDPVRVFDLARRMIELAGFSVRDEGNPNGDIAINITGLRPGEKLYEELLIGGSPESTIHSKILKASEPYLDISEIKLEVSELMGSLRINDVSQTLRILSRVVPEYSPTGETVDWTLLFSRKNRHR